MTNRNITKTKYLAVFATTTLIFIVGILIGQQISNSKISDLEIIEQELRVDTMAIELQYLLLAENPCKALESTPLSEELYTLGSKLSYMEDKLGPDNPSVLRLKEYYSLLEIRHWLFLKRTKQECNRDYTLILYFYSKQKETCPKCEEQGYVLTYLRETHPEIRIYSFDFDIGNTAIDTLKELYMTEQELPVIIIDEEVHHGFKNKEAIEKIISGQINEQD